MILVVQRAVIDLAVPLLLSQDPRSHPAMFTTDDSVKTRDNFIIYLNFVTNGLIVIFSCGPGHKRCCCYCVAVAGKGWNRNVVDDIVYDRVQQKVVS